VKVELELWHLVTLLLAFFGCVAGFGKLLLAQFEKRLAAEFAAQARAREQADAALSGTLARHLEEERAMASQLANLERDFLNWKGELPIKYVLREDYIRGQVTLEAKQDALHAETRVVQMQLQNLIGKMEGKAS
jgi:hypothetical protein